LAVHISKLFDKCLDDNLRGIEHVRLRSAPMLFRFERNLALLSAMRK
jgi:hypothetical protein